MSKALVNFPFIVKFSRVIDYLENFDNCQVFYMKRLRPHLIFEDPFLVDKGLYFCRSFLLSD